MAMASLQVCMADLPDKEMYPRPRAHRQLSSLARDRLVRGWWFRDWGSRERSEEDRKNWINYLHTPGGIRCCLDRCRNIGEFRKVVEALFPYTRGRRSLCSRISFDAEYHTNSATHSSPPEGSPPLIELEAGSLEVAWHCQYLFPCE